MLAGVAVQAPAAEQDAVRHGPPGGGVRHEGPAAAGQGGAVGHGAEHPAGGGPSPHQGGHWGSDSTMPDTQPGHAASDPYVSLLQTNRGTAASRQVLHSWWIIAGKGLGIWCHWL